MINENLMQVLYYYSKLLKNAYNLYQITTEIEINLANCECIQLLTNLKLIPSTPKLLTSLDYDSLKQA